MNDELDDCLPKFNVCNSLPASSPMKLEGGDGCSEVLINVSINFLIIENFYDRCMKVRRGNG